MTMPVPGYCEHVQVQLHVYCMCSLVWPLHVSDHAVIVLWTARRLGPCYAATTITASACYC